MTEIKKIQVPWTNVYGIARTLLAVGTLITLLFNNTDTLFKPLGVEISKVAGSIFLTRLSIFSILSDKYLELAKWLSIIILLIVISGWRPRISGILHWWVSFSFASSCIEIDGGDQVIANLSLFLLPVTLTDSRKWHWTKPDPITNTHHQVYALIAISAFLVIRFQVAIIYFQACVAKFRVEEWANGTALYYWFIHPTFGLPDWLKPLVMPMLTNSMIITFLTWSILVLVAMLFMGLFMEKKYRPHLLKLGLVFHFGIIIVHGLFSFSLAMTAALILYLRPIEKAFNLPLWVADWVKSLKTRFHFLSISKGEALVH